MRILVLFLLIIANPELGRGEHDGQTGSLFGVIYDSQTKETIPYVYLHIEEIKRFATSSRSGEFQLTNLPPGEFTLIAHRLGYAGRTITIYIEPGKETEISFELHPTAIRGEEVQVRANRELVRGSHLENASLKIAGDDLRENLGLTLSETLLFKPGFDQRSMGAVPSRPVIRGLGDQRIIILQDGQGTGDVSFTSADHAVTIDPLGADEIEIARGPMALMYGANAVGGVINVVRNQIPTSQPAELTGIVTLGASSVNNGFSGAGMISFPWRNLALTLETSTRYGDDFRSPAETIQNSDYFTNQNSLGVSRIMPWGYSGLAVSSFYSRYGIPPDPVQGHVSGVDIEMSNFLIENRNEIHFRHSFFRLLDARMSYAFYNHKEFETATVIGTEYQTHTVNLSANTRHQPWWEVYRGVIGFSSRYQYYFLADRETTETHLFNSGVFAVQQLRFSGLDVDLGLRFDIDHIAPFEEFEHPRIGNIRNRTFMALSGSVGVNYEIAHGWFTGATFLHSYRPPTADELHSRGPHIAAYSFEVGNPDLDPERGLATEAYLRYRGQNWDAEITGYYTWFTNYIYPRDTGMPSPPFPRLNIWQFESTKARIYGLESSVGVAITSHISAEAGLSYTIAERESDPDFDTSADWQPLPMIPPLTITAGMHYQRNQFRLGSRMRHAEPQNRTAQFELPTRGYTLVDIHAQYRILSTNRYLHTLTLRIENLLNEEYRSHLSRLKEVFPEPGRNFEILYRVYF